MNISVIIPALNEAKALPAVLTDLQSVFQTSGQKADWYEIIVADNGSTDRTSEVAVEHGARVTAAPRRGYGSACLAGISALAARTEVVVFMDGDHSDYAEDLPTLLGPLREDRADMVLGERVTLGEAALAPQQQFGNRLACILIQMMYGHRYRDLSPFRAIRRSSLAALGMQDSGMGWTVEMQIKAVQVGLRIQEIPVRYRPRIGQSKISGTLTGSIRAGCAILWAIARYAR